MASIKIPDNLKEDMPHTPWGKVLSATPVIMTVIATMLAGLASSEMTKAQYSRSYAAQLQSKAGDQWGYFQAKRMRGALQRSTLDMLATTGGFAAVNTTRLMAAAESLPPSTTSEKDRIDLLSLLTSAEGQQALELFSRTEMPALPETAATDATLKKVLGMLETAPEPDTLATLATISDRTLTDALQNARERARAFDTIATPVNRKIEYVDDWLEKSAPAAMSDKTLIRDFTAARLRFTAARYDAEARLNQTIASLYELLVRKNNVQAERHHARSQRFFYGMLAAQMGVIISTFAMAARKRNLLWSLATAAGVAAILFAAYVYLYV